MATNFTRCVAALLAALLAMPACAQLIISEFRLRGPNGASDEFIEIYNNSGADHTVAGGGSGYAVATPSGGTRGIIPNGTVIPHRGHYLLVNSTAYSLGAYPAGSGTTATGDLTYITDIPDNAGIALFNTSEPADFTVANRLDAAGSTSEANTLYKEGSGYPALTPFDNDLTFVRDTCGKHGSNTTFGPCIDGAEPIDTNSNGADFFFADTNGISAGAGQRLGAPGPQGLTSPISSSGTSAQLLDGCAAELSPPNQVRDPTNDAANNATFGTLDIRRTFTNTGTVDLTRLRFRVVDLTTFPAPGSIADLRPRTSPQVTVSVDRPPCGTGAGDVIVVGTTLEQPPIQPNGGGFNSSLSVAEVTPATPLAPGASIDVRFMLGIQQIGKFKLGLVPEGIPGAGDGSVLLIEGCTESCAKVMSVTRASAADPTNAATVDFDVLFSDAVENVDAADFLIHTSGGLAATAVAGVTGSGASRVVTVNTGSGDGLLRLDVRNNSDIVLVGGTTPLFSGYTAGESYTLDRTAPSATIEQATAQADPTATSPIHFTVTFSEPVDGFDGDDIALSGDGGATTAIVSGGPSVFDVAVGGMTGVGAVIASIEAGAATDAAGNPNGASTSSDNSVLFDAIAPTVQIEQANGQDDPTAISPIRFTVTFSEPVTGFDGDDIALGGSAAASTALVSGGPTVFAVDVGGMNGDGTVTAAVAADAAIDVAGNPSEASTSADNSVVYDITAPTVSVNQAIGQADPDDTAPIHFTVTFSEPVSGFEDGDILLAGTAGASAVSIGGGPVAYDITVGGMTTIGTVIVSIPAGAAFDATNHPNTASDHIDNSVTFAPPTPTEPTSLSALSGEGEAVLTFKPPLSDGGLPILGYTAVCEGPSGAVEAGGSGSPLLVTGLTNGVTYDCAVLAYTAAGDGAWSGTVAVVPRSVPDAPTLTAAEAGDAYALLYLTPPPSDGGSAILQYEAMCSDGTDIVTAIGTGSPITVTGLANFTTYSCVVLARNAFGDGPPSAALQVRPPDNLLYEDGFEPIETF